MQLKDKLKVPFIGSIVILFFIIFSHNYFPRADLSHLRLIDRWRKENSLKLKDLTKRIDTRIVVNTKILKIDNNKGYGAIGILVADQESFEKGKKLKEMIEIELKPPFPVIVAQK